MSNQGDGTGVGAPAMVVVYKPWVPSFALVIPLHPRQYNQLRHPSLLSESA